MNEPAKDRSVSRFVDRVGTQYGVQSVLEGSAHGESCGDGAHLKSLAARGVPVTVADPSAPGRLPEADLAVSFEAGALLPGWEDRIVALARAARKVLIVVVHNPERFLRLAPHATAETADLARVLWSVGRVREHAYLAVPSWVLALKSIGGTRLVEDVLQAPVSKGVRMTAPLHAFVVDTAPRTPQARRRLGLAAG